MITALTRVFESKGARQSLLTIGGNFFSTGFSAVALILISRLLGPLRFGEFSIGFSIVLILNRLTDIGLNATIHKFASKNQPQESINRVFSYTLKLKLFIAGLILITGVVLTPFLQQLLRFENQYIIVFSFFLNFATVFFEQLTTMLQALHRFAGAVLSNFLQAFSKFLFTITFFLLGFNNTTLLFIFYMIGPLVPVIFAAKLLPKWVKVNFQGAFKKEQSTILPMLKHTSIAFISAGIIENIDVLFVQRYLNTYETGLYSGISRVSLLLILIAYSLGNVLYPRVARYSKKTDLLAYWKKAVILSTVSVLGILAFLPFSQLVIHYTIGPQYLSGNPQLLVLMASSFLTLAAVPFMAFFYTFKADWYFSVSGILQLLITLGGSFLYVPIYGLEAAAWTRLATRLALFLFTMVVANYLVFRNVRKA